ncbi:MAG: type II toxin-antitoxin system RelE/ParE family toxin [Treponema sp.]|nr:type II toxin-antitoxin system RelE/ParE family toxin [Treponema sp.]
MENKFTVEFYETAKGKKPCLDFLNTLEVKLRAKAFRDLNLLQEKGTELRLPYSRHLDDGIFELRTIQGNNIIRSLYFFFVGSKIIVTHGFRKKNDKTPPGEIDRAKEYRKDYLANHPQKEEKK